jgi:hypothetical protein
MTGSSLSKRTSGPGAAVVAAALALLASAAAGAAERVVLAEYFTSLY